MYRKISDLLDLILGEAFQIAIQKRMFEFSKKSRESAQISARNSDQDMSKE